MRRSFFVAGVSCSALSACSAGGQFSTTLKTSAARLRSNNCGLAVGPDGGCNGYIGHVSSASLAKATNYHGGILKSDNGLTFKTIDKYGASFSGVSSPGTLTLSRVGSSFTLTSSHPVFSCKNFSIGASTFTNVSEQAGLPMYRLSDPAIGSGAVWLDASGVFNVALSPMGDQIAQGGCGNPCGNPATAPDSCQVQATGLTGIAYLLGAGGVATAAQGAGPYGGTLGALFSIFGIGLTATGSAPCPVPAPGQPTPGQIMPSFSGNTPVIAGDGTLPDGGGVGSGGTDQWDMLTA